MATSCKWRQTQIFTPVEKGGKVIYVINQRGRQQIDEVGHDLLTTFSTEASRFEFITIQESLLAQGPVQEEQFTAQFLKFEEELQASAAHLGAPFHFDNIKKLEPVVVPFVVYYFSFAHEERSQVAAVPINLYNGMLAPKLLQFMQQYPLSREGASTIIAPNFDLEEAFVIAAALIELLLANEETGVSSLLWCDWSRLWEQHKQTNLTEKVREKILWEDVQHRLIGLQPVEYINLALILVPHLFLVLKKPIDGRTYGLLDPILESVYLLPKGFRFGER